MITEDYVSYEVAKLLKEKGFDEICRAFWKDWNNEVKLYIADSTVIFYYCRNTMLEKKYCSDDEKNIAAPTLQMTMKWLREVHNKHCDIGYDIDLKWFFQIIDLKEIVIYDHPETKYYHIENETGFNSYEEAVEAAIKYSLENFII